LDKALDSLDDAKRAVFVLVDIEELPVDEVARIMEIPTKTVYSRLYVAREKVLSHMRRALGASGKEPL
jgi:RNA polymerase sigma-70 factor (ECF subfamily)